MAREFTLGKNERLKSRKQIEQLFNEGRRFMLLPYRVHFSLKKPSASISKLQFGIGVSSKNFRRAVDRNKIKRWTREAFRQQKSILIDKLMAKEKALNVFLVFTSQEFPDFGSIKNKVDAILRKLTKLVDETDSSDT